MRVNPSIPSRPKAEAHLRQCLLASLVLEVSARKAGNVHPQAEFIDSRWQDFVASAIVVTPILARAAELGVGQAVLAGVQATQRVTQGNPNLGMLLLLAPLAAAGRPERVTRVLEELTLADARAVYDAIALARPGGLGKAGRGDVTRGDVLPLRQAMQLAADRDAIARQYVTGFADVFALAEMLVDAATRLPVDQAIVLAHLHQMAQTPDTLIARKCGPAVARQSQQRARAVLDAHWPESPASMRKFRGLDRWLRLDGHARNPGASADLVAAALWVALRQKRISQPSTWRENLWS